MLQTHGEHRKPDVVVGLEARGFLFGPSLALRLGAAFVPVRKKGKLPGTCETTSYKKEYGEDFFQMQSDAIKPGQKVIIVDDIIATGEESPLLFSFFPFNNPNLKFFLLPCPVSQFFSLSLESGRPHHWRRAISSAPASQLHPAVAASFLARRVSGV